MNINKPNTDIRVAIFNSFENRNKVTTAAEVDDIATHVKDAISQKFTQAMLKDRKEEICETLSSSFGLIALNSNINKLVEEALIEVFKNLFGEGK